MRLLADENIPRLIVDRLLDRGHDVQWVTRVASGATDEQVLRLATTEARTLLTMDKDFGELAFRRGLSNQAGIILIRPRGMSPDILATTLIDLLGDQPDLANRFWVFDGKLTRSA